MKQKNQDDVEIIGTYQFYQIVNTEWRKRRKPKQCSIQQTTKHFKKGNHDQWAKKKGLCITLNTHSEPVNPENKNDYGGYHWIGQSFQWKFNESKQIIAMEWHIYDAKHQPLDLKQYKTDILTPTRAFIKHLFRVMLSNKTITIPTKPSQVNFSHPQKDGWNCGLYCVIITLYNVNFQYEVSV